MSSLLSGAHRDRTELLTFLTLAIFHCIISTFLLYLLIPRQKYVDLPTHSSCLLFAWQRRHASKTIISLEKLKTKNKV